MESAYEYAIVHGMKAASERPIEKNLVLVGAGNAHLVFVKRFGMRPIPGVAVTLVNPVAEIPYSAMVPAHIAGDYSWNEISIDLVRLCAAVGVRLVADAVQRVETKARRVHFEQRPPLAYDALSLGLGSIPACPASLPANVSFVMRPLGTLLRNLTDLEKRLQPGSPAVSFRRGRRRRQRLRAGPCHPQAPRQSSRFSDDAAARQRRASCRNSPTRRRGPSGERWRSGGSKSAWTPASPAARTAI